MNRLAHTLASIIKAKVLDATTGRTGTRLESRFIFHGPPLELLEQVYDELAMSGGIQVKTADDVAVTLPVLLQLPAAQSGISNPAIGVSGRCDESHLLHLRNDPHCPTFVALVPPGQHNNKSVESTTDEFGVGASNNTSHSAFDDWWGDDFVQQLVTKGLEDAGLDAEAQHEARLLAEHGATAADGVDIDKGTRRAAWRLLSRIFSIPQASTGLAPKEALALACGMPRQDGEISSKIQLDILDKLADSLADGFGTGIDRMRPGATAEVGNALDAFLSHIRSRCAVPTAFERATPAFYLPADALELEPPPSWWITLTAELWSDLMAEEPDEVGGDLLIECTNAILPVGRGMPAIVKDEIAISVSTGPSEIEPVDVLLERSSGGARSRQSIPIQVPITYSHQDASPPTHKAPITYKASAPGRKAATAKVISMAHWAPGMLVSCRIAKKLSPPRKPTRATQSGPDWETTLSLPGSGRYELVILASAGTHVASAIGITDDSMEIDEGRKDLDVQATKPGEYQVEIEADGKYQLDITFQRAGQAGIETCRVHVTCEEADEEGYRSEFERLIKLNRRHLEKFDKLVVQLDRHARTSSLQSWLLDEQQVAKSFRPLVIADDYASRWAPPDWDEPGPGPCLSQGRFLHDPRPDGVLFDPPPGFVEARKQIAQYIRETDEQSGLVESAPLGSWIARKADFKELVETYLSAYMAWVAADPDIACWIDSIVVTSIEPDGRTLSRVPDAIILSPLHPLRLAWHCVAQQVLYQEVEGDDARPCPAASILDPDCVPDMLTMSLQAPGGIEKVDFLSVECNSDYWSVLWNGLRLRQLAERCKRAPFDDAFGITVGGISSGFSSAQVARALEDISDLLAAKPIVSLVVSSAGGSTDACNEGLVNWCTRRFGTSDKAGVRQGVGPRMLEVFDTRSAPSRPDDATIANLAEDTGNLVRWFNEKPAGSKPDLGIIAQLDSAEPESSGVGMRSPLGPGGLIRHRVRRQLPGAFLSESRQGLQISPCNDVLTDKVSACMLALESRHDGKVGLRFAPNVHAISGMLEEKKADFVAVSSTAIDPACFLGGWIKGAYLWDYDLPAYSHRAGDTSGYYLLSQVKDADRDALQRVLSQLPGCKDLGRERVEQILLEVARRGIPTVRGLAGDDTGATGDLGLFMAVRLLQDQFRVDGNVDSLLPVLGGSPDDVSIAIVIPVDPFRGYLADLTRSLGKDRKDASLLRPDLLVVGIRASEGAVRLHLTPVEVKCRQQNTVLSSNETLDALAQARALSSLFQTLEGQAAKSMAWRLAYQHLLLSMVGFGLRVYSQHQAVAGQAGRWAGYHERIAAAILGPTPSITIDSTGRLVVVDGSAQSDSHDCDGDGLDETIVIAPKDAGRIVSGDAQGFYDAVRSKVGDWRLLPPPASGMAKTPATEAPPLPGPETPSTPVTDAAPPLHGGINEQAPATQLPPTLLGAAQTDAMEARNGIILSLGRTTDGFEPRSLSLNVSDTRLNNLNLGVVGDLGTGKTQLLKSLIFQIATAQRENRGIRPRFLIFDYKRDYSSPDFVAATGAKVVRPTRLPLNLFDTSSMGESAAPWLDRFRFFADVLDKVYSGIGPVQRDKLKAAVRSAYETCKPQGRPPTIYDIHAEYRTLLGGKSDSPMAIIDDLVDMEVFAREAADTLPFDQFLDGIVVISLDAMGQDDRSKNMLVAIMLNMFYENMLKTPKRPFMGSDPQLRVVDSYLLVDEADNIMRYEFDVLRKLLLQGREFGTGVILASQYLRHFKAGATDYRDPLLTWFIHKVPNATPAELGALGFTSDLGDLSERVKTLPNHHCLFKTFDVTGEVIKGLPFYELAKDRGESGAP